MSKSFIEFDTSDFEKKLQKFKDSAERISSHESVDATEVLTDEWISANTSKISLEQFENDAPFEGRFDNDGTKVERDNYIISISSFENFEDLLQQATADWAVSQLKF